MSEPTESAHISALCPRCNYDLSGIVSSWTESCPLRGTCSECGLTFSWADLLSGKLSPLPWWSVERDSSRWLLKIPLHWFAMFFPKHTWTSVRMEHPIRLKRLIVLLLVSMAVAHLIAAAQVCQWRYVMGPNGYDILNIDSSIQAYVFDLIWPHRQIIRESLYPYSETNYHPFRGITAAPALFLVLSPLALFLFHQTLSRVKAGWDHITRIGSYTLALAPIATTFVVWFSSFMYGFFFSLFFDPSDFQGTAGPPSSYLLASMQFDLIYNASCLSIVSLFALMWWYRVASCYLQLNHARWVAIAIILVAGGMATLIEMTVWHNQLNEIITRWIDLSLRVRNGDDY